MSNQRGTFAKRNREMKLKDRAREKAERRSARKLEQRDTRGPEIAWDEAPGASTEQGAMDESGGDDLAVTPPPER